MDFLFNFRRQVFNKPGQKRFVYLNLLWSVERITKIIFGVESCVFQKIFHCFLSFTPSLDTPYNRSVRNACPDLFCLRVIGGLGKHYDNFSNQCLHQEADS